MTVLHRDGADGFAEHRLAAIDRGHQVLDRSRGAVDRGRVAARRGGRAVPTSHEVVAHLDEAWHSLDEALHATLDPAMFARAAANADRALDLPRALVRELPGRAARLRDATLNRAAPLTSSLPMRRSAPVAASNRRRGLLLLASSVPLVALAGLLAVSLRRRKSRSRALPAGAIGPADDGVAGEHEASGADRRAASTPPVTNSKRDPSTRTPGRSS